jgi:hypothetical protein
MMFVTDRVDRINANFRQSRHSGGSGDFCWQHIVIPDTLAVLSVKYASLPFPCEAKRET